MMPIAWLLTACEQKPTQPLPASATLPASLPSGTSTATPTLNIPSPTPLPLAARVNGEPLTLAAYQLELSLYQASGVNLAADAGQFVLDNLIDETLLAQAARQAGFVADETALQQRLERLAAQMGGAASIDAWLADNGYSQGDFHQTLKRAVEAAWMRDRIIAAVPSSAEQVHARQILLYNSAEAEQVLAQIRAGADFAKLALTYDPLMGGELGWFPQGYLPEAALEQAAFALQPGEYSAVIQTPLGFHILQVVERQADRPLTADVRLILQEKALARWLSERRLQSHIETIP